MLDGLGDGPGHRRLAGPGLAAAGQLRHDPLEGGVDAMLRLASPLRTGATVSVGCAGVRRSRAGRPSRRSFAGVSTTDGSILDRIPVHVGCVMDGNGRWAQQRGLKRTEGHAAGEEALFDAVEGALELGIKWLTVYAFSTENWRRPADEVRYLMGFNESLLPAGATSCTSGTCACASSAGGTGGCRSG